VVSLRFTLQPVHLQVTDVSLYSSPAVLVAGPIVMQRDVHETAK